MFEFILTADRPRLGRSFAMWRDRRDVEASILLFFTFLFLGFLSALILLWPCLLGLQVGLQLLEKYLLLTGISAADMTLDIHSQ